LKNKIKYVFYLIIIFVQFLFLVQQVSIIKRLSALETNFKLITKINKKIVNIIESQQIQITKLGSSTIELAAFHKNVDELILANKRKKVKCRYFRRGVGGGGP